MSGLEIFICWVAVGACFVFDPMVKAWDEEYKKYRAALMSRHPRAEELKPRKGPALVAAFIWCALWPILFFRMIHKSFKK